MKPEIAVDNVEGRGKKQAKMTLEGSIKFHNFEDATERRAGTGDRKSCGELKFIFQWLKKFMTSYNGKCCRQAFAGRVWGRGGDVLLWFLWKLLLHHIFNKLLLLFIARLEAAHDAMLIPTKLATSAMKLICLANHESLTNGKSLG